jgi:hypothetical protein
MARIEDVHDYQKRKQEAQSVLVTEWKKTYGKNLATALEAYVFADEDTIDSAKSLFSSVVVLMTDPSAKTEDRVKAVGALLTGVEMRSVTEARKSRSLNEFVI